MFIWWIVEKGRNINIFLSLNLDEILKELWMWGMFNLKIGVRNSWIMNIVCLFIVNCVKVGIGLYVL